MMKIFYNCKLSKTQKGGEETEWAEKESRLYRLQVWPSMLFKNKHKLESCALVTIANKIKIFSLVRQMLVSQI